MLLSKSQTEAYNGAQELNSLNKTRQKLGEDGWERLLPKAKHSYELFGTKLVFVDDDKVQRGITGILATRLLKVFKCPSIIITRTQDGRAIGSMRSNPGFNCHEFLSRYSELFLDFGGHACAGGFSLKPENVDELAIRIANDVDYIDCPDLEEENEITIDTTLKEEMFNKDLMKIIENLEPYGEQWEPVKFLIEKARIENLSAMQNSKDLGSAHLRMTLAFGTYKWPAVFWSAGQRVGKDFSDGEIVDVVFRMGRNYYKNQETIQLTIEDLRLSH